MVLAPLLSISIPTSFNLRQNISIFCHIASSITTSLPQRLAATINVPASILSGIILYSVPLSVFTPFISMQSVPAPSICAPIEIRKLARSTVSVSRAALFITVLPSAMHAAIIKFSVAPLEGKSRSIMVPFSLPPLLMAPAEFRIAFDAILSPLTAQFI